MCALDGLAGPYTTLGTTIDLPSIGELGWYMVRGLVSSPRHNSDHRESFCVLLVDPARRSLRHIRSLA